MDYKNGKIYTIRSMNTDKIYIGSSCSQLSKRLSDHKSKYKQYLEGKRKHSISSYSILELGNYFIELLENYPCSSKEELHKREGELIREHKDKCVNLLIAGRNIKEYVNDNKDKYQQYQKKYREENKDEIKQYGNEYRVNKKDKINEKNKQYRDNNKDKIKEYKKIYYEKNKQSKKLYWKILSQEKKDEIIQKQREKRALKKEIKLMTECDTYDLKQNNI